MGAVDTMRGQGKQTERELPPGPKKVLGGVRILCLCVCLFAATVMGWGEETDLSTDYGTFFLNHGSSNPEESFSIYQENYGRAGARVLNHQSSLLEQIVLVVNNTTTNWGAVKLMVSNVHGGQVYNVTSMQGDVVYELLHNYMVPANGGMVKFVVEYRVEKGKSELEDEPSFAFQPVEAEERKIEIVGTRPVRTVLEIQPFGVGYYSVELPSAEGLPSSWSMPVSPYGVGDWSSVGVTLSFDAEVDRVYEIQFSDDGIHWFPALPQVKATSSIVFWVDKGAPKTPTHPMLTVIPGGIPSPLRLYRVMELPIEQQASAE